MIRVLFVCMGNICRSPTAQGAFSNLVSEQNLVEYIDIDSAGTHAYHIGEQPDGRAQQAAEKRGIDISSQRARQVNVSDFHGFDYILAMDQDNFDILMTLCPKQLHNRVHLFMDFAPGLRLREVPDPYFGGEKGFDAVLDLVKVASTGLLNHLIKHHQLA